ncbi:MAG TPA: hypothetical protein VFO05_05480 [Candidatus Limnocylindrales bacterium]|nr:hypothetical protein [Candidatus Limnocylindrales bacterium]
MPVEAPPRISLAARVPADSPQRVEAALSATADPLVEAKLRSVVDSIARRGAVVPGVDAVLLGGSLAWGEASAWAEPDGTVRVEGDVEAYLVGRSSRLRREARRMSADLSRETGVEVNVAWLLPRRLAIGAARNIAFRASDTILAYELATASRLLAGIRPEMRRPRPETLPIAEGVRLILNRAVEASVHVTEDALAGRWLDKLLMAAGDALLLVDRAYAGGYATRRDSVTRSTPAWLAAGWLRPESIAAIDAAFARKLGQRSAPPPGRALVAETVHRALWRTVAADLGLEVDDPAAFPAEFAKAAPRGHGYLRYEAPLGLSRWVEAVTVAARGRRAGVTGGWRSWLDVVVGRPASLAILGAGAPLILAGLGATGDGPLTPSESARFRSSSAQALARLGVRPSGAADQAELGRALVRAWLVVR